MKKISKIFRLHVFVVTILMSIPMFMGSCNDDDNSPNENDDENSARIYEELKTRALIASLCKTDTLEDGTITYSFRRGKQLYPITPTIYYIGIDSLVEAENTYFSIISVLQDSISPIMDYDIQQGDCHLSFVVENKPDEIARIDIDCPALKDYLTSIVFIPLELWPENAATPFNYLSLWKNNEGHYYLCVKESKGGDGIMITFDGGYEEDWFRKYDYWQGQFYLWHNTATAEAFDSFCYLLQNLKGTKYKEMLSKLSAQKDRNGRGDLLLKIFDYVSQYQEQIEQTKVPSNIPAYFWSYFRFFPELAVFDRHYTYDHGLWWAHYCYYIHLNKTKIYMDGSCTHYENYYEHKNKPTRGYPSHSFTFGPSYKKDEWSCVYAAGY